MYALTNDTPLPGNINVTQAYSSIYASEFFFKTGMRHINPRFTYLAFTYLLTLNLRELLSDFLVQVND